MNSPELIDKIESRALEMMKSIHSVQVEDPLPPVLPRWAADIFTENISEFMPDMQSAFAGCIRKVAMIITSASGALSENIDDYAEQIIRVFFHKQIACCAEAAKLIKHWSILPPLNWRFGPTFRSKADEVERQVLELWGRVRGVRMLDPLPPPLTRELVDGVLLHGQAVPLELNQRFLHSLHGVTHPLPECAHWLPSEKLAVMVIQTGVIAYVVEQIFPANPSMVMTYFTHQTPANAMTSDRACPSSPESTAPLVPEVPCGLSCRAFPPARQSPLKAQDRTGEKSPCGHL